MTKLREQVLKGRYGEKTWKGSLIYASENGEFLLEAHNIERTYKKLVDFGQF